MKKAFEADTGRVLNIVINSLYSEKEIFLRELISNSSDALDKRRFLSLTSKDDKIGTDELKIEISTDKKNAKLIIKDNGIGMSLDELESSLGTIAKSGTTEFLTELENTQKKGKKNKDVNLIGQFGVGFYSAFMVSDRVEVTSKKVGESNSYIWSSDGVSGYEISPAEKEEVGTEIVLYIKKSEKEYLDKERIGFITRKYSDHLMYPVSFFEKDKDSEVLNKASAIWTREKKDISDEQYEEFYKQIGAGFNKPLVTLHNKVEGTLSYINLLFIPDSRPFDLFQMDVKSKIKLYSNRVLITDDSENILPRWLRFVKGVVDTSDVDLNVSREMLQHNTTLSKISKALKKRVINELKKMMEKNSEKYNTFWKEFGIVMKEGIYEDFDLKADILGISKFYSMSMNKEVFLSEYTEKMKPEQKEIFYIAAENKEMADGSPHLEVFKKKNLDVLFFTDPIDTFWLSTAGEFEEKKFTSITKGDIDLSAFSDGKKDNQKKEKLNIQPLVEKIKEILGENVQDVKESTKLVDSPCCLVAPDTGMDVQMERIMKIQNKDFKGMPRILEINPDHDIVKKLNKIEDKKDEALVDAAYLLFDQAKMVEGELPLDISVFNKRLSKFMGLALK
jgi:molecular chaperone HtpG